MKNQADIDGTSLLIGPFAGDDGNMGFSEGAIFDAESSGLDEEQEPSCVISGRSVAAAALSAACRRKMEEHRLGSHAPYMGVVVYGASPAGPVSWVPMGGFETKQFDAWPTRVRSVLRSMLNQRPPGVPGGAPDYDAFIDVPACSWLERPSDFKVVGDDIRRAMARFAEGHGVVAADE